jgi:hypothetical protein
MCLAALVLIFEDNLANFFDLKKKTTKRYFSDIQTF